MFSSFLDHWRHFQQACKLCKFIHSYGQENQEQYLLDIYFQNILCAIFLQFSDVKVYSKLRGAQVVWEYTLVLLNGAILYYINFVNIIRHRLFMCLRETVTHAVSSKKIIIEWDTLKNWHLSITMLFRGNCILFCINYYTNKLDTSSDIHTSSSIQLNSTICICFRFQAIFIG